MSSCSRLCTLVLQFHVYAFLLFVTSEFLVGLYTEDVLAFIQTFSSTWVLRDVIGWHKFFGKGLAIVGFVMMLQKIWLVFAKPSRPVLEPPSFTSFLIQNHWWLLVILFPAQYLTTVMAGDVAGLLGVDFMAVFACHWYIACAIMGITISLFLQKLFALPNSPLRPSKRRALPQKQL